VPVVGVLTALQTIVETADAARNLIAADPSTLNPVERGVRTGLRQYCRGVASLPAGGYTLGVGAGAVTDYACAPYYDEEGDDPGSPPQPAPFTGGQCPTAYTVTWQVTCEDSDIGPQQSPPSPEVVTVIGPIPPPTPNALSASTQGFRLFNANGSLASERYIGSNPTGLSYTLSAVRQDAAPDDCGDPPGTPPQPPIVGNPYDFGTPEVGPDGVPVTTAPPTVNIPINIDVGGINVPITFGNGDAAPDPRPPVGVGPEAPPTVPSPQGGDQDFGEPPEDSEWVGFYYVVSPVPGFSTGIVGTEPVIVYPRAIGNARLVMAGVDGGPSFTGTNNIIRALGGAVFRPNDGVRVTGSRVSVSFPLTVAVFPLFAPVE
jgi:hypothetical protein